jgi:hypothetical protein
MDAAQERRAGRRAPLAGTAILHVRDDKVPCEIVDVSMLGMGVLSPRWLLDGEFVRVVFRLGAANSRERIQQADGVIVRREQGEIGCRLGIQFTVIEGQVASQIHHYVDLHGPEPSSRRRTGEYAPVEAYPHADTAKRVTTELPAAGGDEVADAATGTDGAEHDVPIDHELMSSYLESLRTVSHRKR